MEEINRLSNIKELFEKNRSATYYLLGFFLGDGYVGWYPYNGTYFVSFRVCKENVKTKLLSCVTSLNLKYTLGERETKLTIYGKSFASELRQIKKSSNGKGNNEINYAILDVLLSEHRELHPFLMGMIDTDGNRSISKQSGYVRYRIRIVSKYKEFLSLLQKKAKEILNLDSSVYKNSYKEGYGYCYCLSFGRKGYDCFS